MVDSLSTRKNNLDHFYLLGKNISCSKFHIHIHTALERRGSEVGVGRMGWGGGGGGWNKTPR